MLDFQVQTLKRVSNLQTKTIEMLEQVTSQMVELHDVKRQIKELESLRDETEAEINP
jgi:predicted phage-related endonuclease